MLFLAYLDQKRLVLLKQGHINKIITTNKYDVKFDSTSTKQFDLELEISITHRNRERII